MNQTMSCIVLHGKQDIRTETRTVPRVQPGNVLIKIERMGICGSDVHYFQHGYAGNFIPKRPFIIGHEAAGHVVEVGNGVSGLSVGSRVAIDPSQPCYTCKYCTGGRYNLCPNMRYLGSASTDPHMDGVFCEYISMPARNCYPVPDQLGWAEAAMIEPLSVAVHAVKRAGPIYGASVLITGGGTIGQLTMLVAKAFGAGKVALSETIEDRRTFAMTQGADLVMNPANGLLGEAVVEFTQDGFDVVIEASGAQAALQQAIGLVRRGGTIVQVGTLPAEVQLPANLIMSKELQLLGSFRFANVFKIAIDLAASGRLNLQPLITQTLPLNDFLQAMQAACSRGEDIKIQIRSDDMTNLNHQNCP